jgi:calcineurin-like phosphoesterase family protein
MGRSCVTGVSGRDVSETFVTSDEHFYHPAIIGYCDRPWSTVAEMNEGLVERWNAVVMPADVVWVLGDWAMGKLKQSLQITPRLNGHKRLVSGNHDKCSPLHRSYRPGAKEMYIAAGFEMVIDPPILRDVEIGGHRVDMCHFPYEGDHTAEDRYADARPADEGRVLLHGHVHNEWAERGRQINVGVDVRDYRPMHADEVAALVSAGPHGVR